MRILGFFISAAVLHAVVLAVSPDYNQRVDAVFVGSSLIQRQMNPLVVLVDDHSRELGLQSADSEKRMLVEPNEDVNPVPAQEFPEEPMELELSDETNPRVLELEEQTSKLVEETQKKPVQHSGHLPPVVDSLTLSPPDEMSAPRPEQTSRPSVDPNVVAGNTSEVQSSDAVREVLLQASPQIVDAIQDVKNPSVVQEATQPRYAYHPAPVYPGIARRRGWEGTVEFNVRVLANGRVGEVTLKNSSGYQSLDNAALRAITSWRFSPARRAGKVVESWVVVPVHFVLDTQARSR